MRALRRGRRSRPPAPPRRRRSVASPVTAMVRVRPNFGSPRSRRMKPNPSRSEASAKSAGDQVRVHGRKSLGPSSPFRALGEDPEDPPQHGQEHRAGPRRRLRRPGHEHPGGPRCGDRSSMPKRRGLHRGCHPGQQIRRDLRLTRVISSRWRHAVRAVHSGQQVTCDAAPSAAKRQAEDDCQIVTWRSRPSRSKERSETRRPIADANRRIRRCHDGAHGRPKRWRPAVADAVFPRWHDDAAQWDARGPGSVPSSNFVREIVMRTAVPRGYSRAYRVRDGRGPAARRRRAT